MKNIYELNDRLCILWSKLEKNKIASSAAKDLLNTAGKFIQAGKAAVNYQSRREESPDWPFFNKPAK